MAHAKEIADRFIDAFNKHDESALRALHAPRTEFEAPGGVKLTDGEAAVGYSMGWLKGFPDARMIVHHEVVSDPWVVQECSFEGTQTGPMKGPNGLIAPTGRKLSGRCVQVGRYENGQVLDLRLYYDQADVLMQLGLMPTPTATSSI